MDTDGIVSWTILAGVTCYVLAVALVGAIAR
jgi:hypothetical protein